MILRSVLTITVGFVVFGVRGPYAVMLAVRLTEMIRYLIINLAIKGPETHAKP
ncbi:MAG: hypothetical protein P8182_11305 [Deltaproteobacteria bacterium]